MTGSIRSIAVAHGRPAGNLSHHKFLGYIQNHDQVGNRAVGDRLQEIAGFDRAKIAAAIVLTSPFIPMLFQGEEWAASSPFQYFADHDDREMARLVSEGTKEGVCGVRVGAGVDSRSGEAGDV